MVADIVLVLYAGKVVKTALKKKAPKVSQTIGNAMYCIAKAKICSIYGVPPSDIFLHFDTMNSCIKTSSQARKQMKTFFNKLFKKKS